MTIKLSAQQQGILDWAGQDRGSINVIARAGCGKTFTLLALVQHLYHNTRDEIFLGAFNRAIAQELQEKLKQSGLDDWRRVQANTLHSAGLRAWRRLANDDLQVDGKKTWMILDELKEAGQFVDMIEGFGSFIFKLVSFAKQRAFGVLCKVNDHAAWYDLIDHFGLEETLPENGEAADLDELVALAIHIFKLGTERDKEIVDYDDMILAPLIHNARIWQKDWVLIDEAQDTNPARRALALKMLKKTGRLVAVGDPAQAIYGFTGADADAMDLIKAELGSIELPLNLTYRCPKLVVAEAQKFVPDIQAHETNPDGIVRKVDYVQKDQADVKVPVGTPFFKVEQLRPDDVVLCRNTAPLIELAFTLIRNGIGCRVEGREIGQGLIALAQKWKIKTLDVLERRLEDYKEREVQKWQAKGREEKAAAVEDKVNTLLVLIGKMAGEGKTMIAQLVEFITGMFGDTEPGQKPHVVTLSTVHKSKGREWDRVYILGRNAYMPSKWARKTWQKEQEGNLQYVAVTRAKVELIDIVV